MQQVTREQSQSFLSRVNLERLLAAYSNPQDHPDLAQLTDLAEIRVNHYNLSIPLYVLGATGQARSYNISNAVQAWQDSQIMLHDQTAALFEALKQIELNVPEQLLFQIEAYLEWFQY